MTTHDKNLILQSCAFAAVFQSEAQSADRGVLHRTHEAAAQLRAALNALPSAIEGCACGCKEFNEVKL